MLEFTAYFAYCLAYVAYYLLAIALCAALIKATINLYHTLVGDIYFRYMKVIYTQGKLLGWTMHTVSVMQFKNQKIRCFSIPFFPVSYDKRQAIELRATRERIEDMIDKGEL